MRRAIVWLLFITACAGADAASVSLRQVDWYLKDAAYPNTEWGAALIDYMGADDILYFNLNVNGSWQVVNEPLVSAYGSGNREVLEINFDLGSQRGVDVTSANIGWSITTAQAAQMPALSGDVDVGARTYRNYFGAPDDGAVPGANETLEPPPAAPSVGGAPTTPPAKHKGQLPNQEQKEGECVQASISNSLKYLKQQGYISANDADLSIEALKTATNFGKQGWTYTPPGWVDKKKEYLAAKNIPVQTVRYGRSEYDKVMEAINSDWDVELWGYNGNTKEGHVAAIQSMTLTDKGGLKIDVRQDTNQGNAGGTEDTEANQRITLSTTSMLDRGLYGAMFNGVPFKSFVVECVPEPSSAVLAVVGALSASFCGSSARGRRRKA